MSTIHKLSVDPINNYRRLSVPYCFENVNKLYSGDIFKIDSDELFHFNQIEAILIKQQVDYHVYQERIYDERTRMCKVVTHVANHQFELGKQDVDLLITLINRFGVYGKITSGSLKRRHIDLWISLILDIRLKIKV